MSWGKIKKTLFGGNEASKIDTMTKGQKALLGQSAGLSQQWNPTAYRALGEMAGQGLTEDMWQTRYRQPMMDMFRRSQLETRQQLAGRSGFHNRALGSMEFDNMMQANSQLNLFRANAEQSYDARRMQAALGLGQLSQGTMGQKAYDVAVQGDSGLFGALAQIGVTAAAGASLF